MSQLLPLFWLTICTLAVTVGAFAGGAWAALGIAGGIMMTIGVAVDQRRWPRPDWTILGFAFSALGVFALLNLQSAYPAESWHILLQEATIFLPLALLFSPALHPYMAHPRLFAALCLGASVGGAALAAELFLGCPLLHLVKFSLAGATEYNRGASYLAVFAFPLLAWLRARREDKMSLILFAAVLAEMIGTESRATKVGLLVGLIVTVMAHVLPRVTRGGLAVLLLLVLVWPFAAPAVFTHYPDFVAHLPPSWHHRVEIWDYMSYRVFERPWLGWGLGTSHLLPFQDPHGSLYRFATSRASHPHNVVLQLWVELGLPGLALGAAFGLGTLWRAGRMPAKLMPFALGAWAACFCISLVAYSFWDDSLWAMFALTGTAFVLLRRAA